MIEMLRHLWKLPPFRGRKDLHCYQLPKIKADLFHPEKTGASNAAAAKEICRGCPVLDACLTWAIDNDEQHGIWAGMTYSERNRERLRRNGEQVPA